MFSDDQLKCLNFLFVYVTVSHKWNVSQDKCCNYVTICYALKRMEDKKTDKEILPLIFDTISHGIFTIDCDGLITSFNSKAEELTGYSKEDVIGKQCSEVFGGEACKTDCALKQSIQTGERTEDRDVTITTKEGRELPITISTAVLLGREGEKLGGVEVFRDSETIRQLRKRLFGSYIFEDIVSKSPSMRNIIDMLPLVANSASTVLIEGASGTGKELISRALHNLGPRKEKPFVAINCGALPDTLLESELFGYKKGAFTDAKRDKPGRFARAEGGTLLLDEVGELSRAMQVKLLRVLQEREYEPLGSNVPVKTDVRVIASTNRDLADEVHRRRFRQDLYFRLNVVRLYIPPLKDRREDIPLLVNHFIDRFNALQGRRIQRVSERVMNVLMNHTFPGNVRELENAIEHAFVVCAGNIIQLDDLPPHLLQTDEPAEEEHRAKTPLENAETEAIRAVLEKHDGNRTKASKELGVSRNTLWRKMKKYGIDDI